MAAGATASEPARFERTYTPQGTAHLTISNVNGFIHVTAWNKRAISVSATNASSLAIEDRMVGNDITITVKRSLKSLALGRADFEVMVPAETSLTLKNNMGDIEVRRVAGHITVDSFNSDVRLADVRSSAVDVKITTGDIFFDGQLREGGSYALQSLKGNIDITVPAATPFDLNARSLSGDISLGDFVSSFSGNTRAQRGIIGSYLNGGPRLTVTAYAGRIVLHKK
ncbi:MAG TPA: DUF4097 family beta strand repeat-containing protein [Blastocatellia bacterium]|nr:DUF4097 family beta strand repeat-containing protein [Blastocatellia bacterium]